MWESGQDRGFAHHGRRLGPEGSVPLGCGVGRVPRSLSSLGSVSNCTGLMRVSAPESCLMLFVSLLPGVDGCRARAKFLVSDVPFSYCSQMLSKEVDACVTDLLKELVRFQDRMYQKDPVKAKTKRRLVLGLREVLKHLKLRKLKCIIISPNCEKIQSKGNALQEVPGAHEPRSRHWVPPLCWGTSGPVVAQIPASP